MLSRLVARGWEAEKLIQSRIDANCRDLSPVGESPCGKANLTVSGCWASRNPAVTSRKLKTPDYPTQTWTGWYRYSTMDQSDRVCSKTRQDQVHPESPWAHLQAWCPGARVETFLLSVFYKCRQSCREPQETRVRSKIGRNKAPPPDEMSLANFCSAKVLLPLRFWTLLFWSRCHPAPG